MKLNNKQLDALVSEIQCRITKDRNIQKEKEEYINHYLEVIKATKVLDQINSFFEHQYVQTLSLDLVSFFDMIGIKKPRYYGTNIIRKGFVLENLSRILNDSFREEIPSLDQIRHKLILESIVVEKGETIEDLIERLVEKFE